MAKENYIIKNWPIITVILGWAITIGIYYTVINNTKERVEKLDQRADQLILLIQSNMKDINDKIFSDYKDLNSQIVKVQTDLSNLRGSATGKQ